MTLHVSSLSTKRGLLFRDSIEFTLQYSAAGLSRPVPDPNRAREMDKKMQEVHDRPYVTYMSGGAAGPGHPGPVPVRTYVRTYE